MLAFFLCLFVMWRSLILSCVKAVLDWTQSQLKKISERSSGGFYSSPADTSLLQSFDRNLWSRRNLNPARPHFPTALQPGNGHLYFFTSIFSLCSQLNLWPDIFFPFFFFVSKLYLIDRFNPGCPDPALSIIREWPFQVQQEEQR